MLTFTQRRDMPGYQCFRGNIKRNGDEAFIAEIGESCVRGEDPSINEMKITKTASCQRAPAAAYVPVLSWDSRAADKLPNSLPKQRVQTTVNGRHSDSSNPPAINPVNLNGGYSNGYTNYNPQRYGDQQQTANTLNSATHADPTYPASVSNRPQISIVMNNDHYEQANGKRKSMVTKRPQRVPYLNYNSSARSFGALSGCLLLTSIIVAAFGHLRFRKL